MNNSVWKSRIFRWSVMLFFPISIVFVVLAVLVQAGKPNRLTTNELDQIVVPADGTMVESNISLESNVRYSIVISGTYRYDVGEPGEFADAQYREDDNDQWTIRFNSVEFDGIRLAANNADFNENHVYTFYLTGKGQPMTFQIYDDGYGDNEGSLTATIYPFQPGVDRDPYANIVLGFEALGSSNTHTDPAAVLGPPSCGTFDLSLGGGWVVVDMGEDEEIIDGDGNDFRVYESDPGCSGGGASAYAVFVSDNPDGPWTEVGTGNGVTSFDLSGSGFSTIRYVRIEDRASPSPPSTPGADIDAVEAIYLAEPDPTSTFELSLPFEADIRRHYDVITSFFDHNYPGNGTTIPQPPSYEIPIYTGEIALQSEGECMKSFGLPIYKTDQGRCIAYDGHNGFDYGLPAGKEIRPAAAGTIIEMTDQTIGLPWRIKIEHSVDGEVFETWYLHLQPNNEVYQEWLASSSNPDQRRLEVSTSRVIGTIRPEDGGRHLHFTVKRNDNYTDPYGWLPPAPDPLTSHNGEESQCLWRFGCNIDAPIDVTTGGAFRSILGDVLVSIPSQIYPEMVSYHLAAIPTFSQIEITQLDNTQAIQANGVSLGNTGHAFILLATDEQGDEVGELFSPLELKIFYEKADVKNVDEATLGLYRWDSDSRDWIEISDANQLIEGLVTAQTLKLGIFALLGEAKYENYLPLIVK